LSPLRAVAQTAPSGPALVAMAEVVESWGGTAVVAAAVVAVEQRLGAVLPAELVSWARHIGPDRRQRRWLANYEGQQRSYAAQAIDGIFAVPGVRQKLRYAQAIAVPRASPHARRDRWRRGWRALAQRLDT
jgi:hypothetical protein